MSYGVTKAVIVQPQSRMNTSINVTPLVDVVLVLLIIFMVVMPLMEKDLAVRIPDKESVQEPSAIPPAQIIVRVASNGDFSVDDVAVPSARELVRVLEQKLASRSAEDSLVFVNPSDEAPYYRLVEAFEGARAAGAQTLGMAGAAELDPASPP